MKTYDLYIIHGWSYDASPWEDVVKMLKTYNIKAKLLYVPGLTEKSDSVWTIQDYVAWAEKNLPDGAIALGHSNGGRILLNLLNSHPKKLRGLILLDSAGIYEFSLKRNILRVVAKVFSPLKHIPLLRRVFHKFIGASDYDKAPENMKKTLHNMIASDKNLKIKSSVKTRIVWGGQDFVTPLRQGQKLHSLLKNSKLKVVSAWPHSAYLKDKSGLSRVIAEQYRELSK